MIAGIILITIFVILAVMIFRAREHTMLLEEVIPDGRIISHEDGVIAYRGTVYICGTHDLSRRKKLLRAIPPEAIDSLCVVDLRFNSQIIIKKGPVDERAWTGPDKLD